MPKKLLVGILFRAITAVVIALPVVGSLVGAALLNHFLGWEGKAFLVVLAGGLSTLALFLALFWVMEDCESDVKEWLDSIDQVKQGRPMSYD